MRNAQEVNNELVHDHQTHQAIDHLQTGISQSEQRLMEQQCIENLYAELQKSIAEKTAYYEQH